MNEDEEKELCRNCDTARQLKELIEKQYRIDHDLLKGPVASMVGLSQIISIALREMENSLPPEIARKIDFSLIHEMNQHMVWTNQILREKVAEILNKNIMKD